MCRGGTLASDLAFREPQRHSSEHVPLSRPQQIGRRTNGALNDAPRTTTTGRPSAPCPISSEAPEAISSATEISVTASRGRTYPAHRSYQSATARPAAPSATPTTPLRQGRPKLSLMMTPTLAPNRCVKSGFQIRGGTVGVDRQQQNTRPALRMLDIGFVDPRIRHHKTEAMRDDHDTRAVSDDFIRFRQDHLEVARLLADDRQRVEALAPRAPHCRDRRSGSPPSTRPSGQRRQYRRRRAEDRTASKRQQSCAARSSPGSMSGKSGTAKYVTLFVIERYFCEGRREAR